MAQPKSSARQRLRPADLVQTASVARRFYLQGQSKVEIAEELGLNRWKVARMIEDARRSGLVHIEIRLPAAIDAELSDVLAQAYGLRRAIVVDTPDDPPAQLRTDLGQVAADLLSEIAGPNDVIGLAWGRTLVAMTTALADLPRCAVVQLTGAVSAVSVGENSQELVRRVAEVTAGTPYPIYAPMVLPDSRTAAALRKQREVAEALDWHANVTIAVVAVGSWEPPDSQLYNHMDPTDRDVLYEAGVRAEVCASFLSRAGEEVPTDLRDRIIAITGDQLRKVPEIIAVAGGATKAEAIGAVLRGGFATTLITDVAVARRLIAAAPHPLTDKDES